MSKTSITSDMPPAFGQPLRPEKHESHRRPEPVMRQVVKAVASLKVTVTLFALSILIVFFGTLAQVDEGVWTVVAKYFRSAIVWVPFQIFFPRSMYVWGGFPFPGGWMIGACLLVNLTASYIDGFRVTFKRSSTLLRTGGVGTLVGDLSRRSGTALLHAGIVVMMLGELVTGLYAIEANMTIETGTTVNYAEQRGATELAFVHHDDKKTDDVIVIPGKMLRRHEGKELIRGDDLPVDVQVVKYMVNSTEPEPIPADYLNPATAGDGRRQRVQEKPEGTGVDAEQRIDMASAYVTLFKKGTDESLGTYLVSLWQSALTDQPQKITVDGKDYDVYLRFKRDYKPYTVTLEKFTHDVYPGTMTPKNFASTVHLVDRAVGTDLETTISMNNPLRYNGETFYQSSFLPGDSGTILQVVRNPGWTMPYISCLMVGLGMLIHFSITLWKFLSTKVIVGAIDLSWPSLLVPAMAAGFGVMYICMFLMPSQDLPGAMRIHDLEKLPIWDGGRPKPIETFANNSLLSIANKRTFKGADGELHDSIRWFLDVCTSRLNKNSKADEDEIFRIDNDQVLNLLELPVKPEHLRYSIKEMAPKFPDLQKEAERASKVEKEKRSLYENKLLELANRLQVYINIAELEQPSLLPPVGGKPARKLIDAIQAMKATGEKDVDAESMGNILVAYAQNDPKEFNQELDKYHARLASAIPVEVKKAEFEVFFNDFEPFYHCTELYVAVFLLGIFSWIGFRTPLARSAFFLCLVTLILHTWAIGARMYISGRPPVTNLYSSAIFVGWGAVLGGLILEVIFRNSFGVVLAAVMGFLSTVIAHNLATDGDTLEMMQAVLDTNFWLATHVVIINIGYAATILAGGLGAAFIKLATIEWFTKSVKRERFLALNRMMYGVLCFATLTSFVGTVLGGIWADQSWGRFWGWDPKENGALMIVIMNALILHARWGGIVQQRGMAVLGLFGNILTSWSWFGVNLLGVGLHAYAGQKSTQDWLLLFIASQVALIVLGLMPFINCWKTAGHETPVKLPSPDSPALRKRVQRGRGN